MSSEESSSVTVQLSFKGTTINERVVELPPWNTHWGRLVYPLLVSDSRDHLFPLGTAFRFSSLGHALTARHNVEEAFQKHHPDAEMFIRRGLEATRGRDLSHAHLVTLNQGPNPRLDDVTLDARSFSSVHAAPPTDLLIGSIRSDERSALIPFISPVVTFAPPRIGEVVRCVGYTDMIVPDGGLSIHDIKAGRISPYKGYRHRLVCVAGRVSHIFIRRFTSGFVDGPCFLIDANVPHGLSGGPIFRENGVVCGMTSAGASTFLDAPATLGSLLYPMFLLNLSFGGSMAGGLFQFTATNRPIAELVATQAIRTDGAEEEQLHFSPDGFGTLVGIRYHKEDARFVFEDFGAYQRNEPAPPLPVDARVKGYKPNLDHPLVKSRRRFK